MCVMQNSFFERYTRVLMETSPEIPIYFLRIYIFIPLTVVIVCTNEETCR